MCCGLKRSPGLFRFWSSQDGGTMPLAAMVMLTLVGFAGLALDGARMIYAKDVLQRSLDAGGLAAGHTLDLDDLETDGHDFFNANLTAGGDILRNPTLDIATSDDERVITLTATAEVEPTFMTVFGVETVPIRAYSEVTRETRGMELALVMDNTGSMYGSKMTAMKNAAQGMIDAIFGDETVLPHLWISLIPYTATVNVGEDKTAWLNDAGQRAIGDGAFRTEAWKGCVMARDLIGDRDDAPPADDPFEIFLWADSEDNDWVLEDGRLDIDARQSARNNGTGPNLGCGPAITPLTASKADVSAAISEMQAWSRGGTTSNLGLVWGWRTLSPRWAGLWGGATPDDLPRGYDDPLIDKVIVVLTDGNNQFFDHDMPGPDGSDFTAYDRLNIFGYPTLSAGRDALNDRFASLCETIKATGVQIFAITFGNGANGARSLYQRCASHSGYYFHAPNNDELATVFDTIGRQLSNLRLSR